jgi:hypothetical protein
MEGRKMKKLLCVAMILSLGLSVVGCSEPAKDTKKSTPASSATDSGGDTKTDDKAG